MQFREAEEERQGSFLQRETSRVTKAPRKRKERGHLLERQESSKWGKTANYGGKLAVAAF